MDTKELTTILAVAMVGCVIVAGFIPVVGESVTATTTFENEGVFNYGIFTPADEYTLNYTSSDGSIVVDGVTVTPIDGVSLTRYGSYSVIASDNLLLRYGANQNGYYIQLVGNDSGGNNVLIGGVSCVATITSGQLSVKVVSSENVETTKIFDFTELYAIVSDDDVAVMKVSSNSVYIKGDSELYGSGLTTVLAWNNMFHFEGTYNDGITISSPNLAGATFDNITWNIENVSGYIDLYKLTSIEFDIHSDDTTVHATYSYFGVPSTITAEKTIHADANTATIISMIPFILIMGIVLMFVGVVLVRRYV